ncbi:acylphosphatase [Pengzhenrongella frigida]|uniref:acylphosphatase n=1 Tax=Pengzhenrongella frigida TaxID=1259133 RepID=UPI001F5CB57D|nr:acylphosphatase [Cellulomonas sp. HLT2-17]
MPVPDAACVAKVRGRVQGVGFRWWTRDQLSRLGLTGSARNLDDGSVEVVAHGDPAAIERLLAALRGPHTPGRVDSVEVTRIPG